MEITNLYELKCYLAEKYPNVEDMDACLKFIKDNCELVDSSESLDDYFEYILPYHLVLEWRSVEKTLKNVSKRQNAINDEAKTIQAQKTINDDEAKTIQVRLEKK